MRTERSLEPCRDCFHFDNVFNKKTKPLRTGRNSALDAFVVQLWTAAPYLRSTQQAEKGYTRETNRADILQILLSRDLYGKTCKIDKLIGLNFTCLFSDPFLGVIPTNADSDCAKSARRNLQQTVNVEMNDSYVRFRFLRAVTLRNVLVCDAVVSYTHLSAFQRNLPSPTSGSASRGSVSSTG
jgi:hypothetical protein